MSPKPALFVVLALLSLATSLRAQCSLKLADLPQTPELRGFRLGMSKQDVKMRVPQVSFGKTDDFGVDKTTINPDFDPKIDRTSLASIRSVSLDFLDQRLTSIWFGYDSSFKWRTVDDFVEGISEALKLPSAWGTWRTRGKQLRCADFLITVSIIAEGPSFRIIDQSAEDLIASRRAEKEAAAENEADKSFEPEIVADASTRTYFTSDCPPTLTISAKDRTLFKSAAEAEKAGFKKAPNCR